MGSVFLVPWTWLDCPIESLHQYGFRIAAMALTEDSVSIDHPALCEEPRLAIVMGTEGDGLSNHVIADADYVVRIPMSHHVDSLNVAAAAAVAFWELRKFHSWQYLNFFFSRKLEILWRKIKRKCLCQRLSSRICKAY